MNLIPNMQKQRRLLKNQRRRCLCVEGSEHNLCWNETCNELRVSGDYPLNSSDVKEVSLKARGRAITTAVDTAEIVRRKFLKELKANKITIGTEEMQREDGTRNVSTIEIKLKR